MDQARIHRFLDKTKKKKNTTKDKVPDVESDPVITEEEKQAKKQEQLRKKVTKLMKKQKAQQVRGLVKHHDDSMPWGQEAHVKVCDIGSCMCVALLFYIFFSDSYTSQVGCRLIQLLIETAYIQPPMDQLGDGLPDIRPAFMHTLKTVMKDSQ